MAERTLNPQDSVDLILLLQSYGETLGTLYPQAHVYDNNDSEITGSPFTLSHVANNLYTLSNAFQVGDSGTYKVVYLVYTDAAHTTRSASHGEIVDILNVKIQSTTGLGGYGSMKNGGGDVIVDMDPFIKTVKDIDKKFRAEVKNLNKKIDKGFQIDIPETEKIDTNPLERAILDIKNVILSQKRVSVDDFKRLQKNVKDLDNRIMPAIKKNRTTIIKSKFDKALLKPIFSAVGDMDLKLANIAKQIRIDNAKMLDKTTTKIKNNTDSTLEKSLNQLNESIRVKLKYTIDALRTLLYMGKRPKQDINITLKKDEL